MKNYDKKVFKSREEWLSNRKIGGSSAAAIVNQSKWLSATKVYESLVNEKPLEIKENERMREGTLAEPFIRGLFELDHPEYEVKNPPKNNWMFIRKDYPLLTVTPDGLLIDKETKAMYGLEIKDVELRSRQAIDIWMNDMLPDNYFIQCLHYMVVMNDLQGVCLNAHLKHFMNNGEKWVFSYAEDKSYWMYRDDPDIASSIKWLEEQEIKFINENVLAHKKPTK